MEGPSDHATLFDGRSGSQGTTSDFGRRLRSLLTPPRTRRSPENSSSRQSPRESPTHLSRATIATSTPATRKSVLPWGSADKKSLKQCKSCDDVGKLEDIFEPRMAPYTPPNNAGIGSRVECASPIEQERLEKLESSLFEPRNAPCTPPLVRRAPQQSSGEASSLDMDVMCSADVEQQEVEAMDENDVVQDHLTVEKLQEILSDMRTRAEESSAKLVQQIKDDTSAVDSAAASQPTVRQVQKIASVGNFQRSFSGRSYASRFLTQAPRSRSVTVC